jgi:mevalonate kinase
LQLNKEFLYFLSYHLTHSIVQDYHGNGKLLLSSEYYVLDGALALALPTNVGQRLKVTMLPSEHRVLHWRSYDSDGAVWFEAKFSVDTFECLDNYVSQKSILLQKILRKTRELSKNFLHANQYVLVETHLEFPRLWGLGSSSTLIHNIAKWANVNAFELLFKTMGGSGYDVACADAERPILYEKPKIGEPLSTEVVFNPPFKDKIYFVYLGKKQSSKEGIDYYKSLTQQKDVLVHKLTTITQKFLEAQTLAEFDDLIRQHENLISQSLKMQRAKDTLFPDFWGEIKSLGAWGGDFILVTSEKSKEETQAYFTAKGLTVFFGYEELIKEA